jgi:hypothetical protein
MCTRYGTTCLIYSTIGVTYGTSGSGRLLVNLGFGACYRSYSTPASDIAVCCISYSTIDIVGSLPRLHTRKVALAELHEWNREDVLDTHTPCRSGLPFFAHDPPGTHQTVNCLRHRSSRETRSLL